MRRVFSVLSLLLVFSLLVGCGASQITSENFHAEDRDFVIDREATIQDTSEAREVLEVLAEYRRALIQKDFGTLNRIISQDYYSNAGTTHTTADNYGRAQLDEIFEMIAQHAEQVRYRISVKELVVDGVRARVDFEYEYAYQFRVGDREEWDAGVDVMRMEFAREGDRWRIIGGM